MRTIGFLFTLVLSLSLINCGGSDDGNGGNPVKPAEKVFNPWAGVGTGAPTEEVSERVRELTFADGMIVSYDGSAEDGSEQLCRRQQSEDMWYQVCMPLVDDPYFVPLESNALVWHPLMFKRFATELVCSSWPEPEEGEALTVTNGNCDAAFFEKMGGEGFSCKAGPVGGDKALVCSDHWAVSANGREEDTKTLCRVHTESGSGRCLGARKPGMESDASLVLEMQRTVWSGYGSLRDNPEQFAPGDVGQLIVPQDVPPGAGFVYASEDESLCRVDDDSRDGGAGTVMIAAGATAPGSCKIFLTIEAPGYADRVLFVELPILVESDAAWADYIRSNNYFYPGESLEAGAVSSSDPAATENRFESPDESVCTVDSETGAVTAVAPGECVIRLIAEASGYLDTVIDKTLPVDALSEGEWTITWADFPTDAVVGVDTATLNPPQLVDEENAQVTEANISIASDSETCIYHAGVLSFADTEECAVTVTARTTREYAPYRQTFRVTPGEGSFTLSWTGYIGNNTATLGEAAPTLVAPSIAPALDGVAYAWAADGDGCEVEETTGVLSLLGAQDCRVTLTASRSGYGNQEVSHEVIIAKISQGDLEPPDHPYGGVLSLGVGKSVNLVEEPWDGEGNPLYSSTDETVCTVDGDGTIMGVAVGTCTIQFAWTGDEYYAPTDPQVLVASLPIPGRRRGRYQQSGGGIDRGGLWGNL